MSDNNNETPTAAAETTAIATVKIGAADVPLIVEHVKERKTKTGVKKAYNVFIPQLPTAAAAIVLVTALIEAAEAANEGGGLKIAEELVGPRAREATAVALADNGDFDVAKYVAEFVNTKASRGDTLKALNEQRNSLTHENMLLMKELLAIITASEKDPNYVHDFTKLNAALGTSFTEQEQIAIRSDDVSTRLFDVEARIAKKEAAAEKAAATRKTKEKAPATTDAPAA